MFGDLLTISSYKPPNISWYFIENFIDCLIGLLLANVTAKHEVLSSMPRLSSVDGFFPLVLFQ